jgi:hypothetical protein
MVTTQGFSLLSQLVSTVSIKAPDLVAALNDPDAAVTFLAGV